MKLDRLLKRGNKPIMTKQSYLDSMLINKRSTYSPSIIKILNWNIQNPSKERAINQINWILKTNANIIVLTEAKKSEGCFYIMNRLNSNGYTSYIHDLNNKDYCVLISINNLDSKKILCNVPFLPHRIMCISCTTFLGNVVITGIYVPSRGPKERRNIDKKMFQDEIIKFLKKISNYENVIICGDYNVIERNHKPPYSIFGEWEYAFYDSFFIHGLIDSFRLINPKQEEHSWFGRKGNGYRFDHIFISKQMSRFVKECHYIHYPRDIKLSDHSAMILTLSK